MIRHDIRHKAQAKNYDCGPTSLAMLLDFYCITHDPKTLEELCRASEEYGTKHGDLVAAALSLGVKVCTHENASVPELHDVLKRGHPVIVNYFNPETRVGHFGVVKGYDESSVIFADPKNGDNYRLTFEEFDGYWHNHGKTLWRWMMHFV